MPGVLLWVATILAMIAVVWRARSHVGLRPYAIAIASLLAVLLIVSASDNLKGYQAVLAATFALAGGLAGATRGFGQATTAGERDSAGAPVPRYAGDGGRLGTSSGLR